jgi:hypothetical protein
MNLKSSFMSFAWVSLCLFASAQSLPLANRLQACTPPLVPPGVEVSGIIAILIGLSVDPPSGGADGYLAVISGSPSLSASPVNGTVYAPGTVIGNGIVAGSSSSPTFQVSCAYLPPAPVYYVHVFSFRGCSGGPAYSSAAASTSFSRPAARSAAPFSALLPGAFLRVHVEMPAQERLQIELLDLSGRSVQRWERLAQGSFEEDFSVAHLPAGLYLLRLSSPSQQAQSKIYFPN